MRLILAAATLAALAGPAMAQTTIIEAQKVADAEKVEELFLWALGRGPTQAQLGLAMTNIEQHAKDRRQAYENIIWALINTKEFILVQ